MTTVTISLPESLKAFIDEQLATKGYGNVSEHFPHPAPRCTGTRRRSKARIAAGRGPCLRRERYSTHTRVLERLKARSQSSSEKGPDKEEAFWIQVIRPNAKDDILRQFRYYLMKEAFDTADSFLAAVEESIPTVCEMPEMGAPRQFKNPMLAGSRFHPVKGFEEILIFYVVHPDALRIVRVLHGKRDLKKILQLEHEDQMPN